MVSSFVFSGKRLVNVLKNALHFVSSPPIERKDLILKRGTKGEFRIFEERKFNLSSLVPVLNWKSTTISPLVPVQSPQ